VAGAEGNLLAPARAAARRVIKQPTIADLTWQGALTFSATVGNATFTLDSAGIEVPSPVGVLAAALAACMSMDVVHVLTKGRHPLTGLAAHLVGERAQEDPHRFTRIALHLVIDGTVPAAAVERAIHLSHDKYCSVWHSMRQDIDFTTTFEIRSPEGSPD
jgi:putative redox protein